jgi:Fis family transcriptional regulator
MKHAVAQDDLTERLPPRQPHRQAVHLEVIQSDRSEPLSKCVEEAVLAYLHTTDGHGVSDLHGFVIAEVERPLLATVMRHTDGNLSRAATILGLTRSTLRKRLIAYGIDRGR